MVPFQKTPHPLHLFQQSRDILLFARSDLGGTLDTGSERLKVSGVMQKAVIEVSEKSTEAAATSAITISNRFDFLQFYFLKKCHLSFVVRFK